MPSFDSPLTIMDGVSAGATQVSPALGVADRTSASAIATFSGGGSPVGSLDLEVAMDTQGPWKVLATTAVNGDGDYRVATTAAFGDYHIRLKYTRTSGTGAITAKFYAKK